VQTQFQQCLTSTALRAGFADGLLLLRHVSSSPTLTDNIRSSNSTLELVQRSEFLIGATSASAGPSSNSVTGFQPLVVPDFLFIFDGSRVSVIPWNQSQCDQSVDVAAAPLMAKNPKEKVYLMKQVAMALRHNQRLQDIENPEGAPLDARELKLSSAFRSHKPGRKTETYKEGQKSTDFRSWNDVCF
jgi:hypothetical protein